MEWRPTLKPIQHAHSKRKSPCSNRRATAMAPVMGPHPRRMRVATSTRIQNDAFVNCLEAITFSGSFATYGDLDDCFDPCFRLVVSGNNGILTYIEYRVSTPLSKENAQKIIQASHRAPFGKKSETIVDTSVRKT